MASRRNRPRGFTLVEVLVAMLILGTAAASLLVLVGQHTGNLDAMRENILARIAAENVMVEAAVAAQAGIRDDAGSVELAGRGYDWEIVRGDAPIEGLETVTVEIRPAGGERVLASLSTLGREPQP